MDKMIAPAFAGLEDEWTFSHVVRHAGLLHLSGVTGVTADPHAIGVSCQCPVGL